MDVNPYIAPSISHDMLTLLLTEATPISKGNKKCSIVQKIFIKLVRHLFLKLWAKLIAFLNKIVPSEDFLSYYHQSQKNFVGDCLLPFHKVIFFLMNTIKGSVQDVLDYFFKAVPGEEVSITTGTEGAFSGARKKLHHQAFIELGWNLVSFFYHPLPCRKWQGLRILSIDGQAVKVSRKKDGANHFGAWNQAQAEACPFARTSHLFDPLNGIVVDALIQDAGTGTRCTGGSGGGRIGCLRKGEAEIKGWFGDDFERMTSFRYTLT
jgi:hypothetical protein